jgi:threonine dehydrogenase-like Zn-dependent dehydrogenase
VPCECGVFGLINKISPITKDILFKHTPHEITIPREDVFRMAVDFVNDGKIPLEKVITHEVCLDELPEALRLCDEELDKVIKVVVYPKLSKKAMKAK